MKYILTAEQMKQADNYTSEHFHVPSIVLMERAAICLRKFVLEKMRESGQKNVIISVVCGTGNNGGDGLALVRLLYEIGIHAKYIVIGDKAKMSEAARLQYEILEAYKVKEALELNEVLSCDYLLDGIFGTGLSRELSEEYKSIIKAINDTPACKIAIDIPSGINATNGSCLGSAVKCDYTLTFGFRKLGQYLGEGREYSGEVICYRMGITEESLEKKEPYVYANEACDLPLLLPKRRRDSHKGNYGKALIIAGKKDMAGASILAAKACIKAGAGLVKVYTEESNRVILQTALPEAMLTCYEPKENNPFDKKALEKDLKWASTLLIGPGMGTDEGKYELFEFAINNFNGSTVIDADGLTLLSQNKLLLNKKSVIITPHVGEMSRLTGLSVKEINENFLKIAGGFSKNENVVTVLKSATTVTASPDGEIYLNIYGNSGMSTGGSGDVLAGIITGLLAQGLSLKQAAHTGVLMHSLAGDKATEEVSEYSLTAGKIIECINK